MTLVGHSSKMVLDGLLHGLEEVLNDPKDINPILDKKKENGWILQLENISKTYVVRGRDRVQAIKDITLSIEAGELVCLVGPSGCGKSTLLNIIAGLETPDDGSVKSFRKNGMSGEKHGNRLLIFQEDALFPWLTVRQNVAYGLKIRKMPKKQTDRLVDDYLRLVGLSHFKEACIHQLSGGMKQRVALARALVLEPEILLMDEPFAALDIKTRGDMYQLLLNIWKETGKTILFITHNVDEALMLSSRIIMMTSHPGYIKKEYSLDLSYPRSLETDVLKKLRLEILQEFIDTRQLAVEEERS